MPTYSFWYTEQETFKGYFEAKDAEEARKLLGQLQDGEIDYTDIETWESKGKDYSLDIGIETLTELD